MGLDVWRLVRKQGSPKSLLGRYSFQEPKTRPSCPPHEKSPSDSLKDRDCKRGRARAAWLVDSLGVGGGGGGEFPSEFIGSVGGLQFVCLGMFGFRPSGLLGIP